jgi:hypothetical protein
MLPSPTTAYPTRFPDAIKQISFVSLLRAAASSLQHQVPLTFAISTAQSLIFDGTVFKTT